jgi:hypothetical protein
MGAALQWLLSGMRMQLPDPPPRTSVSASWYDRSVSRSAVRLTALRGYSEAQQQTHFLDQLVEQTFFAHQLGERVGLCDLTLAQHKDVVRVENCVDAMMATAQFPNMMLRSTICSMRSVPTPTQYSGLPRYQW